MSAPGPPFTPVALRPRRDGWTAARQIAFVEALAESACVEAAARRVGMSVASAYALRKRPAAHAFCEAWDAALDMAMHRLEQAVVSRAIHGVARPVFYKGAQVGEWRHYDERLAMFLLRYRRANRFGAWHDRQPAPIDEHGALFAPDEGPPRLNWHCEEIADIEDEPPDVDADADVDAAAMAAQTAADDESPRA